jgi:predicted esterase
LRNWPRESALVCGTISLLACSCALAQADLPVAAAPAPEKTPAIALLDAADAPQWQAWTKDLGWKVIASPTAAASAQAGGIDARVQALDAAVGDAIRAGGVDPGRIYLAGRGEASAAVFYTISRIPDRWAAALALGGSPEAAVTTGRVFAANFTNAPVLWVGAGSGDSELAEKLRKAGVNLEWRAPASITNAAVFQWLLGHRLDEFPASIDCETNSPSFGRCYWIRMTKFDPTERNDILPPTRVPSGSGASLDMGNFGFKPDDPGPGLLVSYLGEKYNGPLKMGDRIVELEGKPIENARQYTETMNRKVEAQRVVVMVLRGKDRIRIETSIVVPRRDLAVTARVQARFDAATRQIEIVSRVVTEMRVTVPPDWVPGGLNWNGLSIQEVKSPGCILLSIEKELLRAATCPAN